MQLDHLAWRNHANDRTNSRVATYEMPALRWLSGRWSKSTHPTTGQFGTFDSLTVVGINQTVAPNLRASSNLEATISTAMMRDAPASAAPLMADSPIPPQPITATVEPGSIEAV